MGDDTTASSVGNEPGDALEREADRVADWSAKRPFRVRAVTKRERRDVGLWYGLTARRDRREGT
jgi:hypothetical protein